MSIVHASSRNCTSTGLLTERTDWTARQGQHVQTACQFMRSPASLDLLKLRACCCTGSETASASVRAVASIWRQNQTRRKLHAIVVSHVHGLVRPLLLCTKLCVWWSSTAEELSLTTKARCCPRFCMQFRCWDAYKARRARTR